MPFNESRPAAVVSSVPFKTNQFCKSI
jgi:hypothetical protein